MLAEHSAGSVCGEAANGRDAVKSALSLKPDIVVLDTEMPEMNGVEAARRIKRALPETEILIYTTNDAEYLIRRALLSGVKGFVLKSEPEHKVIDAISALAKHEPYFGSAVSAALLKELLKLGPGSDEPSLLTFGKLHRDVAVLTRNVEGNCHLAEPY